MNIKTQSFLILGVSKSGYNAGKYILSNNGTCYIYEDLITSKTENAINELIALGAVRLDSKVEDSTLSKIDVLVISPGVPINHSISVRMKNLGKKIIGELEFGFLQFLPLTVAVTGTNGKTTTVSLISEILKEANTESIAVGNIGLPVTEAISSINKNTTVVCEVSSFQLESVFAFCPHVACMLNIAPDHIERHYTMENYVFLKKRIFKNQTKSEYAVLNYDDTSVRAFSSEINANIIWVSLKEKVNGAYYLDGKLYYKDEFIINEENLTLKGKHNVYNALFSIAVAKLLKIETEHIFNALKNFKGVKFRNQLICEKSGIKYINDSKATNIASTISALENATSPTVLILGGSDKGESFDSLFDKVKLCNVRHVVLTGATRYKLLSSATKGGYYNVTVTPSFENAVKVASLVAEQGDTVLLSPACASFDEFSSFEERGEAFNSIVESLN